MPRLVKQSRLPPQQKVMKPTELHRSSPSSAHSCLPNRDRRASAPLMVTSWLLASLLKTPTLWVPINPSCPKKMKKSRKKSLRRVKKSSLLRLNLKKRSKKVSATGRWRVYYV